jgi:hypothetical protein
MGTNYKTALVFGVDLGDLTDPDTCETWAPAWMLDDDGSIDDWDPGDHLARKLGWQEVPRTPGADRGSPEYEEWVRSRTEAKRLVKAADYGCSIDSYGHSEGDLSLLVQVDASVVSGDVWRCVPVDPATLNPSLGEALGWAAKLERYLDALEIPTEHRTVPGWLLTGSVG